MFLLYAHFVPISFLNYYFRQRKLEEALLYSGQFKDAVLALIDWLDKAITSLEDTKPYHGDLDTVTALIDQHKVCFTLF